MKKKEEENLNEVDLILTNEFLKMNARHIENYNEIVKHNRAIEDLQQKELDDRQSIGFNQATSYQQYKSNKERLDNFEKRFNDGIIVQLPTDEKYKLWFFFTFCLVAIQYIFIFWFR